MSQLCRWGFLGAAVIARKNWESVKNAGNSTLVAVASRSPDKAQQFINELQACVPFSPAPQPCTYDDLIASSEIDAIYIPLPTGIRKEWVIKAANAGKHVLCEKPCAPNAHDLSEMIAACRANNVQFMDGVMFMHSDRLRVLRETLNDGHSVGDLRRLAMQFSFNAPEEFFSGNIRSSREMEPLGCLGDLGWYTIRFALWVMQYAMPKRVKAHLLKGTAGENVPVEFDAELFFDNGVTATFFNAFNTFNQQWAHISGTHGHLLVPDFVLPYYGSEVAFSVTNSTFHVEGCQFDMEDHTRRVAVRERSNNARNAQETYLFRNFADLVLSGRIDPHWSDIALQTQRVMDACVKSAEQGGVEVTPE